MTSVFTDPPYRPPEREVALHIATRVVDTAPGIGEVQAAVNLIYADDPIAGQNVFVGPERAVDKDQSIPGAIPGECVFVLGTGGPPDQTYLAETTADADHEAQEWPALIMPAVFITIRGKQGDYDAGKLLADAVQAAIDKSPPPGYFEARAIEGQAAYVREDDENHHIWSISVELQKDR